MSAEAPEDVKVTACGHTSLHVAWKRPTVLPGQDDFVSYSFGVFIRPKGPEEYTLVYQTKDDDYEFRISDLDPGTTYQVYVQSFGIRPGDCSPVYEMCTSKDAPELPPRNLTVVRGGQDDEVIIQWESPEGEDEMSPEDPRRIKGYRLFCDREGVDEFEEYDVENQHFYKYNGINLDSVYRFQVMGYNDSGEGPETPILRWSGKKPSETKASDGAIGGRRGSGDKSDIQSRGVVTGGPMPLYEGSPVAPSTYVKNSKPSPPKPTKVLQQQESSETDVQTTTTTSPTKQLKGLGESSSDDIRRASEDAGNDNEEPTDQSTNTKTLTIEMETETKKNTEQSDQITKEPVIKKEPAPKVQETPKNAPIVTIREDEEEENEEEDTFDANGPVGSNKTGGDVPRRKLGGVSDGSSRPLSILLQSSPSTRFRQVKKGKLSGKGSVMVSRACTIRGKRNGVKKAKSKLALTVSESNKEITPLQRTIEEEKEKNRLVVYISSVQVVRETYLKCQKLTQLLYNLRVGAYFRDISMDKLYAKELQERLPGAMVPQIFAKGIHLGDYDLVFSLNERGLLKDLFAEFEDRPMLDCTVCGGSGFILCTWCNGSKKSAAISNRFETNKQKFLTCTVCNENALERCREC
eukprot:m.117983 g.117983  ORF g.117983 m.117983 type:complete len:634 (+) comp14267_c0_seq2:156-2057(+)